LHQEEEEIDNIIQLQLFGDRFHLGVNYEPRSSYSSGCYTWMGIRFDDVFQASSNELSPTQTLIIQRKLKQFGSCLMFIWS